MDVHAPDDDLDSRISEGLRAYAARRIPAEYGTGKFVASEPSARSARFPIRLFPVLAAATAVLIVVGAAVLISQRSPGHNAAQPLAPMSSSPVDTIATSHTSATTTGRSSVAQHPATATTTTSRPRSATSTVPATSPLTHPAIIATHPVVYPKNVVVTQADNGQTITLHLGQHLVVILGDNRAGGLYWQVDAARPAAVLATGPQTSTAAPRNTPGCDIPGVGCGTVSRTFQPVGDGTATVTASRTSCGEALRCTPPQGSFIITVKVSN